MGRRRTTLNSSSRCWFHPKANSLPYLHGDRLLTLEDRVEFFILVMELNLSGQETKDLLALLLVL